jgi:hypothetical protein
VNKEKSLLSFSHCAEKKAFAKIGILEKGMARPMKKPIFWNTLAIYLLLYNNILIVISLVLALKAVVAGTAVFDVTKKSFWSINQRIQIQQ